MRLQGKDREMMKKGMVLAVFAGCLLFAAPSFVRAQDDDGGGTLSGSPSERKLGNTFVCTATNALKDKKCSVSCPSRETADCEDADGSDTPVCQCTKS